MTKEKASRREIMVTAKGNAVSVPAGAKYEQEGKYEGSRKEENAQS
jgi:hypothetical protein